MASRQKLYVCSIIVIDKLFCVIEIDFDVLVKGQSRYCSIIFDETDP